jgi:single-strand DNA-binding protein
MNKCVFIGRLTKDVELRYSQGGVAVSTFTLAVDRKFKNKDGQKEADFIQIKAFRQLAELVANYLSKGKMAAVSGALQISSYNDKDGNKKYSTDVIADDCQFLSPKGETQSNSSPTGTYGNEVNMDQPDIPF